MHNMRGAKFGIFVTCFVGAIGAFLYPVAIAPMLDSSDYKKSQSKNRATIIQEEIQPGGMKVWSDPFDRKKSV